MLRGRERTYNKEELSTDKIQPQRIMDRVFCSLSCPNDSSFVALSARKMSKMAETPKERIWRRGRGIRRVMEEMGAGQKKKGGGGGRGIKQGMVLTFTESGHSRD
jgi:hypothetical protein